MFFVSLPNSVWTLFLKIKRWKILPYPQMFLVLRINGIFGQMVPLCVFGQARQRPRKHDRQSSTLTGTLRRWGSEVWTRSSLTFSVEPSLPGSSLLTLWNRWVRDHPLLFFCDFTYFQDGKLLCGRLLVMLGPSPSFYWPVDLFTRLTNYLIKVLLHFGQKESSWFKIIMQNSPYQCFLTICV